MNIQDTAQLLMMLWSAYPNAPRLSAEDQHFMTRTWAMLFAHYPQRDVWYATQWAMRDSPKWLPSAPRIKANLRRMYAWQRSGMAYEPTAEECHAALVETTRWEPELVKALGYRSREEAGEEWQRHIKELGYDELNYAPTNEQYSLVAHEEDTR